MRTRRVSGLIAAAAAAGLVVAGTAGFAPAPGPETPVAPAADTSWGSCQQGPGGLGDPANASLGLGVVLEQSTDTYDHVGQVIEYTVTLVPDGWFSCFSTGRAEDALGNVYDSGPESTADRTKYRFKARGHHIVTQHDIDVGHVDNYANGHSVACWIWYPAHAQSPVITATYVAPEGE